MIRRVYGKYLPERPQQAREFEALGRMARSVAVRRVVPCADLGRVPELCRVILDDYQRCSAPID